METLLNEFYKNLSNEDKFMYSEIADFAIKLGYKPKQVFPRYEIKEISYLGVIMLAAIIRLNEVLG